MRWMDVRKEKEAHSAEGARNSDDTCWIKGMVIQSSLEDMT